MHTTLNPKQTDPYADPHDDMLVARIEEELSSLAPDAVRDPSDPQPHIAPDFSAGPVVPPVDTTFRPTAVNNVRVPGRRPAIGRRALRAFTAFLLTACIGAAAIASQSSGNVAKQMIGKWVPKLFLTSSPPLENTSLPEQPSPPAVQATAAQAAPPAQTAAETAAPAATAPSPDSAQLLQSMTRDLAAARQEIDQLKASRDQMSRDMAKASEAKVSEVKTSQAKASQVRSSETKASEQNLRPRISALAPRPLAAPPRRPMPSYPPPQAAAAPALPPAAAPYVPRQPEPPPQATAQPPADPELSPPRPPMPVLR
jgi:hypothetical protein